MDFSKISSVLLFVFSYPFTEKINAIGISNLPAALKAYHLAKRKDREHDANRRMRALMLCLFHSSVVFSALFGRYPRLIVAHAVVCIGLSVKESVEARWDEEERKSAKAANKWHGPIASVTGRLRNIMFGSSPGDDNDDDGDGDNANGEGSRTAKAHNLIKRTKAIVRGRRDSATDDMVWGAFQASFVLLDHNFGKALSYAWLLFLLTVLEDTLINPKLSRARRMKRFAWVLLVGYICQNLLWSSFFKHWLRLGRYALNLASN